MSADDILAVSPEEAARRLGLGRTTVFALIRDGELASIKVRDRRLIRVEALREFLDRQEMNSCERGRAGVVSE